MVETAEFLARLELGEEYPDVQRDMDLIRDLLLKVEANVDMDGTREFPYSNPEVEVEGHSGDEMAYHVKALLQAGYLQGNAMIPAVSGLTWEGHEFLDNIRSPSVWEKTKQRVSGLPTIALKVVAEIAMAEVRKHLGLP